MYYKMARKVEKVSRRWETCWSKTIFKM